MPLFPVLALESVIQESDKTRLDGVASYASGIADINQTEISPSKLVDFIDASDSGYLDWEYPFEFELDELNQALDFKEDGGAEINVAIPTDSYTLAELAQAIQDAMNAAGGQVYTVAISAHDEFVFSAPGKFQLLGVTGLNAAISILPEIGFGVPTPIALQIRDVLDPERFATSLTGERVETIEKTVTLKVTNEAADTKTIQRTIQVISEKADALYSNDSQLRKHEPDIANMLPKNRATFKDVHRRAQELMLAWLDTQGVVDDFGTKLVKRRILDTGEVTEWATHLALQLIFEGSTVSVKDIFQVKASTYRKNAEFYRDRAALRVDLNQDGRTDLGEQLDMQTIVVVRR